MRRLGLTILALTLVAPLYGLAVLARGGPAGLARATVAILDVVSPGRAVAQVTTLPFKSLPPESASALERERAGRRRVRASVEAEESPAPAEAPAAAEAPPAPEAPPVPERVTRTGDMTRVGNDIHVEQDEVVHGDITAIRGDITVDGSVHGSVVSFAGDIYLNETARVDGDVVCVGGELHEEPGAYVSGERVTALGGRGESLRRRLQASPLRHERNWGWRGLGLFWGLLRLVVILGLTLFVAWLFQSRIAVGVETLKRQPGLSLGVGALVHALFIPSLVALALVMALLCITIVGIPLALAALFGYLLFFLVFNVFGLVVGASVIGERIASRRGLSALPTWQSAVLGVLVVGALWFAGRILEIMGVVGLGALGKLVIVLTVLAAVVVGTMGGGAWLKWEFSDGLFGRWRGRWEGRSAARTAAVPPAPYGPPPGSPYGPAAPVPPGQEPPSGPPPPA